MRRLTLGEARSVIARVTQSGECPENAIVAERINEAQERLINKGKWAGLLARYVFCTYSGCITLPREVESLLQVAVCNTPVQIRNQWFEFIESVGPQSCGTNSISDAISRGSSVLFKDICGAKYLRVYSDLPEAAGARILIRGYDENGNRVMTLDGGQWIDGEYLTLHNTPQTTTKLFQFVESVVKPVTVGFTRLYQVDPDTSVQSSVGVFAPGEKLPSYRRYFIPSIQCDNVENPTLITALVKRRFVPAVNDNDDLLITNLAALKAMVQAIEKYESGSIQDAMVLEKLAETLLSEELAEYEGGAVPTVNVQIRGWAMGNIPRIR